MWIFVGAIVVVALLGAFPSLRPLIKDKPLSMVLVIQMFMLMAGALIIIFTKTNPSEIGKNEVFRAGMIAVVAVFGVAWMADTVFEANLPIIKASLSDLVKLYPWTFAIALLLVSKLVNSQAAAIAAMVPLGLSIGVPPGYVVAFAAACYGYYILPTYPSDLATIQFDRSGTTKIGKYVINHSFILPGLIGVDSRPEPVRAAVRSDCRGGGRECRVRASGNRPGWRAHEPASIAAAARKFGWAVMPSPRMAAASSASPWLARILLRTGKVLIAPSTGNIHPSCWAGR
jgi:hypothetical protein